MGELVLSWVKRFLGEKRAEVLQIKQRICDWEADRVEKCAGVGESNLQLRMPLEHGAAKPKHSMPLWLTQNLPSCDTVHFEFVIKWCLSLLQKCVSMRSTWKNFLFNCKKKLLRKWARKSWLFSQFAFIAKQQTAIWLSEAVKIFLVLSSFVLPEPAEEASPGMLVKCSHSALSTRKHVKLNKRDSRE